MLLAAAVLPLEGEAAPSSAELQGWFYSLLKKSDANLHDRQGPKPFALGLLKGKPSALRLAFLDGDLHARLSPALWDLVGKDIVLGTQRFRVGAVLEADHPWAGLSTYPRLFQGPAESDYPLRFTSPTFFKRKGTHYPLPEPKLVFGSLYERFKAYAPIEPPEELPELFDRITLRKAELHTRSIEHETRGVGVVGTAVYHLPRASGKDTRWLTALWRFAFYSGVGAKTTMGFGMVRPLKIKESKHAT